MFWEQFWPQFSATLIGVLLGGAITFCLVKWQIKKEITNNYTSTLRSLFSEFQENERALRQGESFEIHTNNKKYKLIIGILNKSVLAGALGSGRLGIVSDHKLIASLVFLERKIELHNQITLALMGNLDSLVNTTHDGILNWFISNLSEKQKSLMDDFRNMLQVVQGKIN